MRPTPVRFSHSNRGASRRRSGFAPAFVAKQAAPSMTLVEKSALLAPTPTKVVKAA
ncbi:MULTISPECIES: hypothetical protein [Vibrio]|uniref:Uncharacterized protein n=1 Tax=Vibrio qingdaonensis TaxID=2829491 RepID=A0A9X3CRH8_9VIBR|nr:MULTISPECIES: hypothetical protein [Vibrio]MCL9776980.1 hypothetical protein [Vibrio methylphosphonaticus]MCW8348237.1 hypothetical protein [Vibrio qingdaonensis]